MATALHLQPGSRVADVGAGGGAFTIAVASRIVPSGHVFATEIEDRALERIRAKAAAERLTNVTAVLAREDATGLAPGCCDAAFLRVVYHHLTSPVETIASLHEALRPGARLAVLDFEPSWLLSTFFPVSGVPQNRGGHGVPASVVVAEAEAAGFELSERHDDWSRGMYALVFER